MFLLRHSLAVLMLSAFACGRCEGSSTGQPPASQCRHRLCLLGASGAGAFDCAKSVTRKLGKLRGLRCRFVPDANWRESAQGAGVSEGADERAAKQA